MQRVEFLLHYTDSNMNAVLEGVTDRLTWLHDRFGEGESIPNQTWFSRMPPIQGRWAFGTYQTLPINPIKFCIWMPNNIKLLYDIAWP